MKPQQLNLTLNNDLSEVPRAAQESRTFLAPAKPSTECLATLDLICEELLVNIITHAYPEGGSHTILFRMQHQDNQLLVHLEDDGIEFNPLAQPTPDITKPVEERPIGGLGVFLVRSKAARLDYQRVKNRNVLQVWIDLF